MTSVSGKGLGTGYVHISRTTLCGHFKMWFSDRELIYLPPGFCPFPIAFEIQFLSC